MAYPTSPERWSRSSNFTMGRAANEETDAVRIRADGDRTAAYSAHTKTARAASSNAAIESKLGETKSVSDNLSRTAGQVEQDSANLVAEKDTVQAALEAQAIPLRIIRECVEIRKQRPQRELV